MFRKINHIIEEVKEIEKKKAKVLVKIEANQEVKNIEEEMKHLKQKSLVMILKDQLKKVIDTKSLIKRSLAETRTKRRKIKGTKIRRKRKRRIRNIRGRGVKTKINQIMIM